MKQTLAQTGTALDYMTEQNAFALLPDDPRFLGAAPELGGIRLTFKDGSSIFFVQTSAAS